VCVCVCVCCVLHLCVHARPSPQLPSVAPQCTQVWCVESTVDQACSRSRMQTHAYSTRTHIRNMHAHKAHTYTHNIHMHTCTHKHIHTIYMHACTHTHIHTRPAANLVDLLSSALILAVIIVFAVGGTYQFLLSFGAVEVLVLFVVGGHEAPACVSASWDGMLGADLARGGELDPQSLL